jgi:hypothetical protein
MQIQATHHLAIDDEISASTFDSPRGAVMRVHPAGAYVDQGIVYFQSTAHGVAVGLTVASDLLPDLTHVELVAARHSLDALGSRCDELMALLEFEDEADARSRGADEVMA